MGANCALEKAGPDCKAVIQAAPAATISSCSSVATSEKDSKGMTNHRLLVACRDNDIGEIMLALEQGAYLETRRPFVMRPKPPTSVGAWMEGGGKKRKTPKEGLTPLMYAAQNGSVAGTKLLLEARAQVAARDEDGLRPLHLAATSGIYEVCSMLLSSGADKSAGDELGQRARDYVPEENLILRADRERWEALLGAPAACPSRSMIKADFPADVKVDTLADVKPAEILADVKAEYPAKLACEIAVNEAPADLLGLQENDPSQISIVKAEGPTEIACVTSESLIIAA